MEFPYLQIYPYLYTQTFSDYILVEAAAPTQNGLDRNCESPLGVTMTFYLMYLPELNFYEDPYFTGIRRMMTLKGVEKYGTVVSIFCLYYPISVFL